jgi:hypothetical protein
MHAMSLAGGGGGDDKLDNGAIYYKQQQQQHPQQELIQASQPIAAASFRIKSHPEDNQGYPEERNMDYDPMDDSYPDDDSPYEGLIQPPGRGVDESEEGFTKRRKARRKEFDPNLTDLNIGI